jgi:hypothetical protein
MMKGSARGASTRIQLHPHFIKRILFYAVGLVAIHAFLPALIVIGADGFRFRPGLRNSSNEKRLDPKQLTIIAKSLREKTGFAALDFDENGFLTLGDRMNFSGGSASARKLLIATLEMKQAINLESCPNSSRVLFARIANKMTYESRATGARITTCSIQIDFSDFSWLRGDKQAMAAFDPGIVIIHELGHAVLGLNDSFDNSPGDCEVMVNRIRRELNLPERQTYIAQVYSAPVSPTTGRAELIFKSNVGNADQGPIFRLSWDAQRVGQILE